MTRLNYHLLGLYLLCICLGCAAETKHGRDVQVDDVATAVSVTSKRERRSDDTDALTPVVNQLSQVLTEMKAKLGALEARMAEQETLVCFTVHFTQDDITGLGLNQPLVFDFVEYNPGGGYDKNTGIFTAPKAGTYVLTLNIQRHGSDEDTVILKIVNGDRAIAYAEAGYSPFEHGGTVVTTRLNQGDAVSVRPAHGTTVWGGTSTTFSAFRISPF